MRGIVSQPVDTHSQKDVECFELAVEPGKYEYGDYFEGDMILTEEQMEDLYSPARNGLISTKYRWPNKTLPYRLTHEHTKEQRDYIELALRKIESVSCVKFIRQTNQNEYIEITVSV